MQGQKQIHRADCCRKPLVDTTGKEVFEVTADNLGGTTWFDEEYMAIGAHVDATLREKIVSFEHVDFSRLIPKDKVTKVEDHRLEIVIKGGSTYFAPVSDRDVTSISNFSRWEQAFRIYSNILTCVYPDKASELIQYNHAIYTAALTFVRDNVYSYDKEFRMHISKFHRGAGP